MSENFESSNSQQSEDKLEANIPNLETETETVLEMKQEKRNPEKDLVSKLDGLFYFLGSVTRKNEGQLESTRPERPLSVRRERARLYKEFMSAEKGSDERKEIIEEAKQRDEALRQFLNQGEVKVSRPDTGEVTSRFTIVNPSQEKEIKDKPPIIIIPGLSNDLACVETMAQELALSGRKVIVVAYPESFMGTVSEEFVDKCKQSPTYEPHAEFFEDAIEQILPKGEFELWGFSTGGPVSAKILSHNPDFSERVTNAVLINPAGAVKQNQRQLYTGVAKEVRGLVSAKTTKFVLTAGRKIKDDIEPEAPEQRKMKEEVMGTLIKQIQEKSSDWESMRVKEGGKIVVISCDRDDITQSRKSFNKKVHPDNPQMVNTLLHGGHNAPFLQPDKTINEVTRMQGK